jgi:hypothetical protein
LYDDVKVNVLKRTDNSITRKGSDKNKPFGKIKGPIFIGRSWAEYMKMFNLKVEELTIGSVLDCAAGASSFTAHMRNKGCDVTAVDILYNEDADILCNKCREHLEALVEGLKSFDHFVWSYFQDLEDLQEERSRACNEFIEDYKYQKGERYIAADLTNLPFEDGKFSMVLCSHLLFIYDHRLDYEFHLKAIKEMLRVSSKELRIYTLVRNRGEKSPFVNRIIKDLKEDIEILKVDYEFRQGGNEMIKIKK